MLVSLKDLFRCCSQLSPCTAVTERFFIPGDCPNNEEASTNVAASVAKGTNPFPGRVEILDLASILMGAFLRSCEFLILYQRDLHMCWDVRYCDRLCGGFAVRTPGLQDVRARRNVFDGESAVVAG